MSIHQFLIDGMWEGFTFFAAWHVQLALVGYGIKWSKGIFEGRGLE